MSVSDEIEELSKTVIKAFINTLSEFTTALEEQYALLNFEDIKRFKKGGILNSTFQNVESKPRLEIDGTTKKGITTLIHKSSLKENMTVQTNEYHSKRCAQQRVLEKGTTLSNIENLVEKHSEQAATNVRIKRERLTNLLSNAVEKEVQVKQEIHMPPPRKAAKNQRINRNRPNEINSDVLEDSIIEVPRTQLDVIVLEDSFRVSDGVRVTRARTKGRLKAVVNGDNDLKVESVAQKGKRTTIKKEKGINIGNHEHSQKDAADGSIITKTLSNSPQKQHVRYDNNSGIIEKIQCLTAGNKEQQMREPERQEIVAPVTEINVVAGNTAFSPTQNKPICVIKPTRKNKPVVPIDNAVTTNPSVNIGDVITDDRDEATDSPQRIQRKVTQFFTPYENSPVKKYVQAYEKLGVETVTRSKAKFPTKDHKELLATQNAKFQSTPLMASKLKNSQISSATKASSVTKELSTTSFTGGRTGSALKASKMEFYERERRRKQKEEEALRKKEALIRAQTEERRRRREERSMKVQQSKMIKEQEKMKQLMSAEKAKEQRFKQILAEKEAKFFKQRVEAAQKRTAASKKDAERNQQENEKHVPVYLMYPPPLLPTPDCYDSDDNTSRPKIHIPYFQRKENLQKTLYQMLKLQSHKGLLLFRNSCQTPNLKEIFPTIQPSKLKRTSSAIWNKTEMSILESMIAEN